MDAAANRQHWCFSSLISIIITVEARAIFAASWSSREDL